MGCRILPLNLELLLSRESGLELVGVVFEMVKGRGVFLGRG